MLNLSDKGDAMDGALTIITFLKDMEAQINWYRYTLIGMTKHDQKLTYWGPDGMFN